jgi:hypothetical protein
MDFDEIQCGLYATGGHPKVMLFNYLTIINNNMLDIQACEVAIIIAPFITGF